MIKCSIFSTFLVQCASENVVVNNENDLSDANRGRGGSTPSVATSILGSLERLVETSFKSNNNAVTAMDYVAQQVMVAKRAFGADLTQVVMEPVNRKTKQPNISIFLVLGSSIELPQKVRAGGLFVCENNFLDTKMFPHKFCFLMARK